MDFKTVAGNMRGSADELNVFGSASLASPYRARGHGMRPVVFFSHSSKDSEALQLLRSSFLAKTGESIETFLSSDGASIAFGRNWVHRIEEALEQASAMFVFVSPHSRNSRWLHFEAGHAYARKIRVVPVGFLGVDLGSVQPPLSILQGFNINDHDGLNNLIAVTNEIVGHKHAGSYTLEDYRAIAAASTLPSHELFGAYGPWVDHLWIAMRQPKSMSCTGPEALERIERALKEEDIEHRSHEGWITLHGISINTYPHITPGHCELWIDPSVVDSRLGVVEKLLGVLRGEGVAGSRMVIEFRAGVRCIQDRFKVSGRLLGTGVGLGEEQSMTRRSLRFSVVVTPSRRQAREYVTHVVLDFNSSEVPRSEIRELLTLLVERGVVHGRTKADHDQVRLEG